jgi:hypothetical protein
MRPARFGRMLGFLLVLGLGGCGPGPQQVSPEEGKAIEADMRKFYQGLKAKKSEGTSPGGPRRSGRGPGSSVP